jgi:addiction module HigA family antidote
MAEKRKSLAPIHPGLILKEDLADVGISINRISRDIRVPMNRISEIVNGKRAITADTALRLARYFGTTAQYWLNLQINYDLQAAERESGKRIERDVLPLSAA